MMCARKAPWKTLRKCFFVRSNEKRSSNVKRSWARIAPRTPGSDRRPLEAVTIPFIFVGISNILFRKRPEAVIIPNMVLVRKLGMCPFGRYAPRHAHGDVADGTAT